MERRVSRSLFPVVGLLAAAAAATAQPARFANARLETRPAAGGLGKTFPALAAAADAPAWVARPVGAVGPMHPMCCYGSLAAPQSSPRSGSCFLAKETRHRTLVP